jgi:hypothetical protein
MRRAAWIAALTFFAGCRCGNTAPPNVDAGHSVISDAIVAYGRPKVMQAYPLARYCMDGMDVFLVRHPPGDVETPYLLAAFDGPTLKVMYSVEKNPLDTSYFFLQSTPDVRYRKYVRETAAKWTERELFVGAAMESLAQAIQVPTDYREVTDSPNTRCSDLPKSQRKFEKQAPSPTTIEIPKATPLYERPGKDLRSLSVVGRSVYWSEGTDLVQDGKVVATGLTDPKVITDGTEHWAIAREGAIHLGAPGFAVKEDASHAVAFDGNLYYASGTEIRRVGKDGEGVVAHDSEAVHDIVADADALYFTSTNQRTTDSSFVRKVPRRGESKTSKELIHVEHYSIDHLTVSNGYLYWSEGSAEYIDRIATSDEGGVAKAVTMFSLGNKGLEGFRVEGQNIFVFLDSTSAGYGPQIGHVTLTDARMQDVFDFPEGPTIFLLDEKNIYVAYASRILKISRTF